MTDCDSAHCQSDQWDSLYSIYSGAPSRIFSAWSIVRSPRARGALVWGIFAAAASGREIFPKPRCSIFSSILLPNSSRVILFWASQPCLWCFTSASAESTPHARYMCPQISLYILDFLGKSSTFSLDHHFPQLFFPIPTRLRALCQAAHFLNCYPFTASCTLESSSSWSRPLVLWPIFKTRLERL